MGCGCKKKNQPVTTQQTTTQQTTNTQTSESSPVVVTIEETKES